jgi:hypothetical protein
MITTLSATLTLFYVTILQSANKVLVSSSLILSFFAWRFAVAWLGNNFYGGGGVAQFA